MTGGESLLLGTLLSTASLAANAPRTPAQAVDLSDPAHLGAVMNLIGEIGGILSPAVSGVLRDRAGSWHGTVRSWRTRS